MEKIVRTIPYGFLGVILGVYLAQLGFSALAIGIVLTPTVLSSAFYTFIVSFLDDRIGRRRTLIFFGLTDLNGWILTVSLHCLVGVRFRRGSSLAGYAIGTIWVGTPLVAAGILTYDFLIYATFRRIRPPEEMRASHELISIR